MSDVVRLYCHINGGIFHPAEDRPTPLDYRYSEQLETPDLPGRKLLRVDGVGPVPLGIDQPRLVIVRNRAGADLQRYPTGDEAAALAQCVLRVGVFAAGFVTGGMDATLLPLRLLPVRPGEMLGGVQALWLAPGAELWLAPENPDYPVPCHILICGGA